MIKIEQSTRLGAIAKMLVPARLQLYPLKNAKIKPNFLSVSDINCFMMFPSVHEATKESKISI